MCYLVDGGFPAASGTDQHNSMSHEHRLVELNHLEHLLRHDLLMSRHYHVLYLVLQASVVVLRDLNARKQVLQNRLTRHQ